MRAARLASVISCESILRTMRGAFLLALFLAFAFAAHADVAVPPLTGRVVDQTGTLSAGDIAALTKQLRDFEDSKGSQIAVLIVPTTQPETIEQFSIRVADAWKVGRKKVDDGAILVIAKNDRHLRIEVGYGLEGALTDATSRRIIDEEIAPKFKNGDFVGGISAGVDRMMGVVRGEPLPAPAPPQWQGSDMFDTILNPFTIFVVFALGMMFRTIFGRSVGAVASGGVVGLVVWLIAGSIAASLIACVIAFIFTLIGGVFPAGGPIVMGGGGPGGSWSGRGGDWGGNSGGFSGGGGGFGGGGASGSW